VIRDSFHRGEKIEDVICKFFEDFCNFKCRRNKDRCDIDLIVEINGKSVLIEVEESGANYWPSNEPYPTVPSNLISMPIRKIKYFVNEAGVLEEYLGENGTVNSLEELERLFNVEYFTPKEDTIRIWLKTSYKLGNFYCIVTSLPAGSDAVPHGSRRPPHRPPSLGTRRPPTSNPPGPSCPDTPSPHNETPSADAPSTPQSDRTRRQRQHQSTTE